jgi:hypothetical protein
VNAASKLGEDTARAGEVLLTRAAKEAASDSSYQYEDVGHRFTEDERVFRLKR